MLPRSNWKDKVNSVVTNASVQILKDLDDVNETRSNSKDKTKGHHVRKRVYEGSWIAQVSKSQATAPRQPVKQKRGVP